MRKTLKESVGTFDESFFPAIYAVEGSRNFHLALVAIRKVLFDPNTDLVTVKLLLRTFMMLLVPITFTSTGMSETSKFLESVAGQVDTVAEHEELLRLIEELVLYVGRLNYWLDGAMPWYQLVEEYEKLK